MTKHVIFLVHGMGDWTDNWSQDFQVEFRTTYESYPTLAVLPFDTAFEFKELNYNSWFDNLRTQWQEDAAEVVKLVNPAAIGQPALGTLLKIAKSPARQSFWATHLLDVFLYRFVRTVHDAVRTDVQDQILKVIVGDHGVITGPWSIVAHSLGTSIIHDTLSTMYSQPLQYKGKTWNLASATRPQMVAMIANVSRLLEDLDGDPYKSVVRPSFQPSDGCCKTFLNARHEFDPFTIPREFRPTDDWPTMQAVLEKRCKRVAINAIAERNVHAIEHYFRNPKVHGPMLQYLTWPQSIPDIVIDERSAIYEAATPLGKFDKLLKELKKVNLGEQSSWKEIIIGLFTAADILGL